MNNPFFPRIGGILSADIAVPQHERVVQFYASVLSTGESPLWREDLMNNNGSPIIGVAPQNGEYANLPLQWMPHIQVSDVARSVKSAVELGGSEVLHGRDEKGKSQWAVILDPNGTAFGLIPVVSESETPSFNHSNSKVGCISWVDLTIANASTARDFYHKVVGWDVENVNMQDSMDQYVDFNMLGDDGKPAAGICHARGVNLGLPPVWLLYLTVGDLPESLRRVRDRGGKIIKETNGADGGYSYAVVQDPIGACMGLVPG